MRIFPLVFRRSSARPRGFALVVTLTLMVLLTILAVGLLTLSSITLRSSSLNDDMQAARANSRMALILAIGDLQKQLGPDTRVCAAADQITGSDASVSSAPENQRQWCGAYDSWPTALPSAARPAPRFLQWFVSGAPDKTVTKSYAETAFTSESALLVSTGSVGTTGDPVRVPLIVQRAADGTKNHFAWWVGDLGTKGLIPDPKDIPTSIAEVRADQQAAPAYNVRAAASGSGKPFDHLSATDVGLTKIASWQSSALLADKPENIRGLFHDLTAYNRGLAINVRAGGFRKDLSMQLERAAGNAPTTALYRVANETGINLQELWVYYNLHKELKRSGGATFTTGGTMSSGTPYLQIEATAAACQNDDEFHFKQPVIISYQTILSYQVRPSGGAQRLHVVADPVITFWNPLDVPVVVPSGNFFTVKYWQIPYDLTISRNGGAFLPYPLSASLSGATSSSDGDSNFMSLQLGLAEQLVFKPGEVIKMSQSGTTLAKVDIPDIHKLGGKKGFNYGGGFAVPVRNREGGYVDLAATESINFKAKPNELTAGATSSSGRSISGGPSHTRHFSVMHHEYYIGEDRGSNSLGIGGMFIDWDFGNRRLKPAENRGTEAPGIAGTKSASERLYANSSALASIFKTIEGRPLPASILSTKQPFLMLSFNAKTEKGSDLGTRCLSRFNPKALHVDFYDLQQKERDMLPYEFTVERLDSWKNRNLEVSTNGNAYFGGGMNAADGTSFVSTHSVPREPLLSLASFQHSFANGFDIQKPKYGYGTLNAREPMLPQISHAIGNSMASPMIAKGGTESSLPGGRPMADHSYLANQALWDDWFLSGIAPQTSNTFGKSRTQKTVASEFFNGTARLPVARYLPDPRGQDPAKLVSTYFSGAYPSEAATREIASYLVVDGMFNVNSTSIEAWKSLLSARRDRPVVVRDANGRESVKTGGTDTPVAGLLAPRDTIAKGSGTIGTQEAEQWTGRRTLNDAEIDSLARAIVGEVRKRGPFLCLSDFINRRPGSNVALARAGAIQSALDSDDVKINNAFQSDRGVDSTSACRFLFPESEQGPKSFGIPGIVKQADILTPIAPVLSVRSDSFLVRGYGEKTDKNGRVLARAWCEAVVRRNADFIDPADTPQKIYTSISTLNKTFGRRFDIVSFRWLHSDEV